MSHEPYDLLGQKTVYFLVIFLEFWTVYHKLIFKMNVVA